MSIIYDLVVYHSPCPDGICAGWIVSKYHKDTFSKDIELLQSLAGKTHELDINKFVDKNVIFVDICPDKDFLLKLSEKCKFIKIIDHHKTNFEAIDI